MQEKGKFVYLKGRTKAEILVCQKGLYHVASSSTFWKPTTVRLETPSTHKKQ